MDKELLKELPGVYEYKDFQATVVDYIKNNKNGYFAITMIEVKSSENTNKNKLGKVYKNIANLLFSHFVNSKYIYTFDLESTFFCFIPNMGYQGAYVYQSPMIQKLEREYQNMVNLNITLVEYPQDGSDFQELFYTLKFNAQKSFKNLSSAKLVNNLIEAKTRVEKKKEFINEVKVLFHQLAKHEAYLAVHSMLVAKGCMLLAAELGYALGDIEKITFSGLLHDIGYLAVPKRVLDKPAKLTGEESALIKLHPLIGCQNILTPLNIFDGYLPAIANHHEFLDGNGYPRGKKGEQVPIEAQIISIIDTYHTITNDALYRKTIEFEDIVNIFIRNAGIKWDTEIVTMFTAMLADTDVVDDLKNYKTFSIK